MLIPRSTQSSTCVSIRTFVRRWDDSSNGLTRGEFEEIQREIGLSRGSWATIQKSSILDSFPCVIAAVLGLYNLSLSLAVRVHRCISTGHELTFDDRGNGSWWQGGLANELDGRSACCRGFAWELNRCPIDLDRLLNFTQRINCKWFDFWIWYSSKMHYWSLKCVVISCFMITLTDHWRFLAQAQPLARV